MGPGSRPGRQENPIQLAIFPHPTGVAQMASRDFAGAVPRRRSSRSLMAHSLRLGHALQSLAVNPGRASVISRHAWRRVRRGVDRYLLLAAMTSIRGRSNHWNNRKSRMVVIQSVNLPSGGVVRSLPNIRRESVPDLVATALPEAARKSRRGKWRDFCSAIGGAGKH